MSELNKRRCNSRSSRRENRIFIKRDLDRNEVVNQNNNVQTTFSEKWFQYYTFISSQRDRMSKISTD